MKTTPSINTQPKQYTAEEKKNEPIELTQESLETLWKEYAAVRKLTNMEIFSLMNEKKIRLVDSQNFEVVVNNDLYSNRFKQYKTEIVTDLRERSGIPELNFTVKVESVFDNAEAKLYIPKDKYNAMVKINPAIENLRQTMFQDIF